MSYDEPQDEYLQEEGIGEKDIQKTVKKLYTFTPDLKALIDDFKEHQYMDEFGSEASTKLLGHGLNESVQSLTTPELKDIMKKKLKKRNSQVKRVNRKSRVFISDSFLKFHLVQNLVFYIVLFTIPAMSVINCTEGHSQLSIFAIGAFMLSVFIVDIVNLKYHIKKELLKLELSDFYGKHANETRVQKLLMIYGGAACELFLTQLNLFDLYTDFAFLTIAYAEKDLSVFFVLSMTSFVLILIPKILSFYIIIKILTSSKKKLRKDPLLRINEVNSSVYDEDLRRKLIFRAFTFSEFRTQALCVDYINYEINKTEFYMSCVKFGVEDLPQFIIQALYLLKTQCGLQNANTLIYASVFCSILSSYCGFLFRISIYLFKRRRLHAYNKVVELNFGNFQIEQYGFKHIRRMMPLNQNMQALRLTGTNNEYFNLNEKRLMKI